MTLQTASGDKLGGVCSLNQTIVRDIRFCAAPQRAGVCTYGNWQQASNPGTFGNTTYNHIVNYLEPCFLAKRGGFRWMINTGSAFSNLPLGSIAQDPLIFQSTVPNVFTQSMISSFNSPEQNLSLYDIIGSSALSITSPANYDNGMGTQVFSQGNDSQRPEVQVLPYFPYRYFNHLGTDANGYYPRQNINVRIAIKNKVGNSVNLMDGTVSMSVAAAEDFTMNVFVGVPVFYNLGYTNPFAPDLVTHSARIDPLP